MEEMATWSLRRGKQGMYREWIGVRVPFEVKRALEKKAKERGLSISDLMRFYVEKGLEEDKQA
jgi:antitoxin component of RelBE/YafQ-DinJ toxin-antitoxin module